MPELDMSSLRVLVVDDDVPSQVYASTVLKRLGVGVDIAESGVEAIEALARVEYALVLMDCIMPKMGGIEAVKRIREGSTKALNSSIPIIGFTADVTAINLRACDQAGMNAYITKPVSTMVLRKTVNKWLQRGKNLPVSV